MGSVCFFPNEAWVGGLLMKKKMEKGLLLAGSYLQNKALYVQVQQYNKQANWAVEVESGHLDGGSLSESNASGNKPPKRINIVKVNQRCCLCLAVPQRNDSGN